MKNELHVNREVTGKSVAALQTRVLELEEQLNRIQNETAYEYEVRLEKLKQECDYYKRGTRNKDVATDCQCDPRSVRVFFAVAHYPNF